MNSDNQSWEFLSLLQQYYDELEEEKEFRKVNESSIMPKYEEYKKIENISDKNLIKFYEFLKIYQVFSEIEEFENFTLFSARKVLDLLDDEIFMEGRHKRKYETHSLIEKFKINIAYQLSKLSSIGEIRQWILLANEIRIKWKDIDMVALIKSGCTFFMKYNSENKISDYKLLIVLNKFIGNQKAYKKQLGSEALEWLLANYKQKDYLCAAKFMLDALLNNSFKITKEQDEAFQEIQKSLNHWKFDAKRKTKLHKSRINNWLINNKSSRLKIIDSREIKEITKPQGLNKDAGSGKASLYECIYRNGKAFIKSYTCTCDSKGKPKAKSILNEIANTIYLSEHNETNIFINFFGMFKGEIKEETEKNEEGVIKTFVIKTEKIEKNRKNEEGVGKECVINLVMEYCSGTLKSRIEAGNIDPRDLSGFTDSILNGFFLLHSYGMAHNDIKPENILVKETKGGIILKIADYDVSSTISTTSVGMSITSPTRLVGTRRFAAPEIIKLIDDNVKKAKIRKMKADVFSIGLVLLYLATSNLPPEEMLNREDYIDFFLENLKIPWLKELLSKMISNDPRERKKIGELLELKKELELRML